MKKTYGFAVLLLLPILLSEVGCQQENPHAIDEQLIEQMKNSSYGVGLSYYQLPESNDFASIPQDPNNPLTVEKVELGKLIFHETAFAVNVKFSGSMKAISCATCHNSDAGFQAGMAQGIADGGIGFGTKGEARILDPLCPLDSIDVQETRTPSILNVAYQKVMRWTGSMGATGANEGTEAAWVGLPFAKNHLGYEGVETQSIVALKGHRQEIDPAVVNGTTYKAMFDAAFPSVPVAERYTKKTAGLAIAAYSRTVLANQAPFQQWIRGDYTAMTENQKKGALLFFGKAGCYRCHNGPSLATEGFHALGVKDLYQHDKAPIYNTSIDSVENLGRGGFTGKAADMYRFKVPQLYNVSDSPFEGHGGSFGSAREIIAYKNAGVAENPNVPTSQLSPLFVPLGLTEEEMDQIADFIDEGLHDDDLKRYVPTTLPSGLCFPNADVQSKIDLGCN
ncbi:cytochrome-c peroxidase [Aureispira anguillae]|uniref:Cytochrome-c peroxidase n=1 Tax=Aureispira anguillae TaxID=2864201 RepID=A0A915YKJ0_9BACT|nr:cytochrome c peroxidase [Aureispira anguillae]BDS14909.1 cytochrome-c peroxidase [Aureispira anguillae]